MGFPISSMEKVFKTAAPDFELSQIKLPRRAIYRAKSNPSAQVIIVTEGEAVVLGVSKELNLKTGDIFFVEANTPYKMMPKQDALVFMAKVPV